MRFGKRNKNDTSGSRKTRRHFTLAFWPDDVAGWLRIPSMIAWIVGILGVVKYSSQPAAAVLKPFNLPPIEFCWLMVAIGGTVYLMSLACWLFVQDVARTCRPCGDSDSENSTQWRSM